MLLTITTTHRPATDLGFLLSKHPERVQEFSLWFGKVHVFYPEASEDRCTAALLLDVDPIGLVRGAKDSDQSGPLQQYVNDRPYVASSLLSTAIAQVFGSALGGRSAKYGDLAATALPLEAHLPAVSCRGGERVLRSLFEPLGYEVTCVQHPLDAERPDWGTSRVHSVRLRATVRLQDLLKHLYVLVPVLDDAKHYWVGEDEIEKLLRFGDGWLQAHPQHDLVTRRYLKHQRRLTRKALEQLVDDPTEDVDATAEASDHAEEVVEKPIRLAEERNQRVLATLAERDVVSVADLGCGEGKLLRDLARDKRIERILGLDVSLRSLKMAGDRLGLERLSERQAARFQLVHGSVLYCDPRLRGFDAATLIEVIEHLEPERLEALARVVFEQARPRCVVITTPNAEFNVRFDDLAAGAFRHADHRFEWTRAELRGWAEASAERFGYRVTFAGIGPSDDAVGSPTQMAVFDLATAPEAR